MGIYAGMITYIILWGLRREGSLSGFSAFVIASTLSIFTYYYAIVSFISLALTFTPVYLLSYVANLAVRSYWSNNCSET